MKTATDVLRGMLRRFRDGEGWTQIGTARNASGAYVRFNAPDAVQWCLIGGAAAEVQALFKDVEQRKEIREQVLERIERAVGRKDIAGWNDKQVGYGSVRLAILAALQDGK